MADETLMRLLRLSRVREERRKARERERVLRGHAVASAQAELVQQEALLNAASARLESDSLRVQESFSTEPPSGTDVADRLAYLDRCRVVVSTEEAATAAAHTVCQTMRTEEEKAVRRMYQATAALRKVEALTDQTRIRVVRAAAVHQALVDDEHNIERAWRARDGS